MRSVYRMTRTWFRGPVKYILVVGYIFILAIAVRFLVEETCVADNNQLEPSFKSRNWKWSLLEEETFIRAPRVSWENVSLGKWIDNKGSDFPRRGPVVYNSSSQCSNTYHYNHCVSRQIPYERTIIDTRSPGCNQAKYLTELPRVTLVLTVQSEDESVILRSLFSIYWRTPSELLREVILVHITENESESELKPLIMKSFPNVSVLISPTNTGVPGARQLAVDKFVAEFLVFLHLPVEVNINWLPPLLEPVLINPRVITSPVGDIINPQMFTYTHGLDKRLAFDWQFYPQLFNKTSKLTSNSPHQSPLLEYRAFAVKRNTLVDLELFKTNLDPLCHGLDIEMSVKTWLCGGHILLVPCSRIGFLYKRLSVTLADVKNYELLATEWFDDYSSHIMVANPREPEEYTGPVQDFKNALACKPFRWFLEKIVPELIEFYPPYRASKRLGVIQNVQCRLCVSVTPRDITEDIRLKLLNCSDPYSDLSYHMHLMSDGHLQLTRYNLCLGLNSHKRPTHEPCSSLSQTQLWDYNQAMKAVEHRVTKLIMIAGATCYQTFFTRHDHKEGQRGTGFQNWVIVNRKEDLLKWTSTTTTTTTRKSMTQYKVKNQKP